MGLTVSGKLVGAPPLVETFEAEAHIRVGPSASGSLRAVRRPVKVRGRIDTLGEATPAPGRQDTEVVGREATGEGLLMTRNGVILVVWGP